MTGSQERRALTLLRSCVFFWYSGFVSCHAPDTPRLRGLGSGCACTGVSRPQNRLLTVSNLMKAFQSYSTALHISGLPLLFTALISWIRLMSLGRGLK